MIGVLDVPRGAGTAFDFALGLVEMLAGAEERGKVARGLVLQRRDRRMSRACGASQGVIPP